MLKVNLTVHSMLKVNITGSYGNQCEVSST